MSALEEANLLAQNPFAQHLKPEEVLAWVGRPDEKLWMERTWRAFRQGCVLGSVVVAVCLIGLFYGPDPFTRFSCRVFLILISLALVVALWLVPQSYRYAPWYALTQHHFLMATLNEGDFAIRRTRLNEIVDVRISREISLDGYVYGRSEIGTLICKCNYTIVELLSKRFKIEMVNQPKQVLILIEEGIERTKTMPKDLA